jgi:type II secretory pathway component PulF
MAPDADTVPFRYKAARADGTIVKGMVRAPSADAATDLLARDGLFALRVAASTQAVWLRRKASRQDLAVVFRNVAALTHAGVPVERAMGASEGLVEGVLRQAILSVRQRVREGEEVSQALRGHPHAFPPIVVGMVRAGERGSTLPQALEAIADQLDEEANLRSQVRAALAYPLLVLVVGLMSVLIMGTVVVPRFAEVLGELGADLPASTRLLMVVSSGLKRFGPVLVALGVGATLALAPYLRRPETRRRIDSWLLGIPLIGPIRLGYASARTCRALGAMLSTGMPLLSALDAAAESSGDAEVCARLARARTAVSQGQPLTTSLSVERALTPLTLQLIGVGESSGDLRAMTVRAGNIAAQRAHQSLRSLIGLVEPALVIGLGLLVAFTAGALLQAVYSVRPGP